MKHLDPNPKIANLHMFTQIHAWGLAKGNHQAVIRQIILNISLRVGVAHFRSLPLIQLGKAFRTIKSKSNAMKFVMARRRFTPDHKMSHNPRHSRFRLRARHLLAGRCSSGSKLRLIAERSP